MGAIALGACGGSDAQPQASCASALKWRGQLFLDAGRLAGLARGQRLGDGLEACESEQKLAVFAIRSIQPEFAVSADSKGQPGLFVALGYLPQLRSHPLHSRLYGGRGALPPGLRCRGRFSLRGTVGELPKFNSPIVVRTAAGRQELTAHPTATVAGFDRTGLPYLPSGVRIAAGGRRCTDSGGVRFLVMRWARRPI